MIPLRRTLKPVPSADRPRRGAGLRAGFTIIELVVIIVIMGILMTYAIPRFQSTRAQRTARNARDVFVWNAQRARARAIQTGNTYLYELDPLTEKAWIVKRNPTLPSDTLLTVNFSIGYEATVSTASNNRITLCYNPRGYAFQCSANSPTSSVEVTFTNATYTSAARIKPMGQIQRL